MATQFKYDFYPTKVYMGATVELLMTITIPPGTKQTADIDIEVDFPAGSANSDLVTAANAPLISPSSLTKGWSWTMAASGDGRYGFSIYPQSAAAVPTDGGTVQVSFSSIVVGDALTTSIPVAVNIAETIEGNEDDTSLTLTKVTSPLRINAVSDPPAVGLGQTTDIHWSASGGTSVIIRGVGPDITIPLQGQGPIYSGIQTVTPNQTVPQTTFTVLVVTPDHQQISTMTVVQLRSPVVNKPLSISPKDGVDLGATVTCDWDVGYASQVLLSPSRGTGLVGAKGPKALVPSQLLAGNQSSVELTLTARGFAPVPAPQKVTVDFSPARILYFRYTDMQTKQIEYDVVNGVASMSYQNDLAILNVTGPGGPLTQYLGTDPDHHVQIQLFTASPIAAAPGAAVTLSWVTQGAQTLKLDPGNISVTSDATGHGSYVVRPTAETTYVLKAQQDSTRVTSQVVVTVAAPPAAAV